MHSSKKPKIKPTNPALEKGIKQLRTYFPYKKLVDEKKDKKDNGSHNQCHIIKIPVNHETRNPNDDFSSPPETENKEIDVAILTPVSYEDYKKSVTDEKKSEKFYQKAYGNEIAINNAGIKRSFQHLTQMAEDEKPAFPAFLEYTPEDREYKPENDILTPVYKKKSSSTFIMDFLYCGQSGRVARAANGGNLEDWLQKNRGQITDEETKEIVAQLFIAIHYWHSLDIIHRDIKTKNILVYVTEAQPRRIHIKLADLDTLMGEKEQLISSIGTMDFLAPECTVSNIVTINGKKKLEKNLDETKYIKALKKPVDCFAVGKTTDEILRYASPDQASENKILRSLCTSLTCDDPLQRMTIDQAMNHSYFGDTPEVRSNYFESIKKKYQKSDEYFNGTYRQSPYPDYDDAFLLLPESLQQIIKKAELLNRQTESLCHLDYPLPPCEKKEIQTGIDALKQMITQYNDHNPDMDFELVGALATINMGIEKAESFLTENSLKKDTRPDLTRSFSCNIKNGKYITREYLDYYFTHASLRDENDFLIFLQERSNPQKRKDLQNALGLLNEYIKTLDDKKDAHTRRLLQNYSSAVSKKMASDMPLDKMPSATELTHRLLFKAKNPTFAVNQKNGTNTKRAIEASSRISHFISERLTGGLATSTTTTPSAITRMCNHLYRLFPTRNRQIYNTAESVLQLSISPVPMSKNHR